MEATHVIAMPAVLMSLEVTSVTVILDLQEMVSIAPVSFLFSVNSRDFFSFFTSIRY